MAFEALPRDRKQVVNARFKGKEKKDKDILYSVMFEYPRISLLCYRCQVCTPAYVYAIIFGS